MGKGYTHRLEDMKSYSPALKCLRYCCFLCVVSFVALILCTMMNGADIELEVPDFEDNGIAVGRESPIADGSTVMQRMTRKKRYVAFPEGSSFSVAFCLTIGFVGNPVVTYFTWSMNWGVAYDLPNETWILSTLQKKRRPIPRPVVMRRQRRELYERLENAVDNMGYMGRQCILRALCESSQMFNMRQKSNLAVEMIKTIFSLPRSKVLSYEHEDLHEYDSAHRRGRAQLDCPALFPKCPISLIQFALGKYSSPGSLLQ